MTILLDTHAFVWAEFSPDLLSPQGRALLEESDLAYVSAVSLYEISAKVRLGKWPEAETLLDYDLHFFAQHGFRFLELAPSVAIRAGRLPGDHRDPFDRLLAATAIELDLTILSKDIALDALGVRRIW